MISVVVNFYQSIVFMKPFSSRKMHSNSAQVYIDRWHHIRLRYVDRCRVAQLELYLGHACSWKDREVRKFLVGKFFPSSSLYIGDR